MSMTMTQKLLRAALESVAEQDAAAVATTTVEPAAAPVDANVNQQIQALNPANDVVELVGAKHEATASKEYVDEVRAVSDGLTDVKDAITLANEHQGGLSMQAFGFLQLAINGLTSRVGLESVDVMPSLESFATDAVQQVSVEEINTLITTVQEGTTRLEARSVEAVVRLIEALAESLPAAAERLAHVVEIAKAKEDEVEGNVVFGDGLHVALAVDGRVPDDLVAYLQRYALLGAALIENYAPASFKAAMDLSTLPESLDFRTADLFWKTLGEKISPVEDPRAALTEDQLSMVLPNGKALFGAKTPVALPEEGHPILKTVLEFNDSRQVQEQTNADAEQTKIEPGQAGYGRRGLALQDIRVIARSLAELLGKTDISKLTEQSKAVRTDVIGAVTTLKGRFAEASPEVKMALADQFGLVTRYLDTVYLLSDWPVLNYLSNLVFTTNAFVLYAERSLALPEGAVADEAPPAEPTPAAEPAAVTDPAAASDGSTPAAVVDAAGIDPNAAPAAETGETGTATQAIAGEPAAVEPAPATDPNAAPTDDTAGLAADNRSSDEIDPAAAAAGEEPPAPGAAEDTAPEGGDDTTVAGASTDPAAEPATDPADPTADPEDPEAGSEDDEDDDAAKAAKA